MVENLVERMVKLTLMEVDVKDLQAQDQAFYVMQPLEIRQRTLIYFTELNLYGIYSTRKQYTSFISSELTINNF